MQYYNVASFHPSSLNEHRTDKQFCECHSVMVSFPSGTYIFTVFWTNAIPCPTFLLWHHLSMHSDAHSAVSVFYLINHSHVSECDQSISVSFSRVQYFNVFICCSKNFLITNLIQSADPFHSSPYPHFKSNFLSVWVKFHVSAACSIIFQTKHFITLFFHSRSPNSKQTFLHVVIS